MMHGKTAIGAGWLALLLVTTSQPAAAGGSKDKAIDSCVAAIYEQIDLAGATRVRHDVSVGRHLGTSRVLRIDTLVFAPEVEKSYASYCVSTGVGEPLKLRIAEG